MREFFGLSIWVKNHYTYSRPPAGAWSWQHLTFVGFLMALMVALAVYFGKKYKDKSAREANRVLVVSAILINSFEVVKIVVMCIRYQDVWYWRFILPLFLCSIQLIAIPMAAFCKGRTKEACLDFVLTFGILGAVFGTVGSTQNYNAYPVWSMDNVFSGVTHSISGFASLYIACSGMVSLKWKNFPIALTVLLGTAVIAYIANVILDYNYMYLMHHYGTPYSIFYNMVNGHKVLYPMVVVGIFVVYLVLFYYLYNLIREKKNIVNN